ncbi:MAG: hypothetical protein HY527_23000 [Betaproteobacteria bacterium]|nr:hypothetical protein [Betaproteobacteria bacterium]
MQTVLTTVVTWLSINAGLPAIYDHPRIEFVSPAKMYAVRIGGHVSGHSPGSVATAVHEGRSDEGHHVEALYDDRSRTIYLPEGWTDTTPTEISVLVHEMVHHLQNVAGLKYECPQAREKPAYVAQDKWLALFGRNLVDEFKLDPMTVLVRTNCMY